MKVQELTLPRPGDGVSISKNCLAVNRGPQWDHSVQLWVHCPMRPWSDLAEAVLNMLKPRWFI